MRNETTKDSAAWNSKIAGILIRQRDAGVLTQACMGRETIIECPRCHKPKLYVNNVDGRWHCFYGSCQISGRLQVRPFYPLGPGIVTARVTPPAAYAPRENLDLIQQFKNYLATRGVSFNVRDYVGAYPTRVADRPAVCFPWNQHHPGMQKYWFARMLDDEEPRFMRAAGRFPPAFPSIYMHDGCAVPGYWKISPCLYVVEGIFDVLKWLSHGESMSYERRHSLWWTRVVSLNGLAMSRGTQDFFTQHLLRGGRLLWVLDNDDAGRTKAGEYVREYPGSIAWTSGPEGLDPGEWRTRVWQDFWKAETSVCKKLGLLQLPPDTDYSKCLPVGKG